MDFIPPPDGLNARFADQIGHSRALRRHGIPEQSVIPPPGVVDGEIHSRGAVELGQQAVAHAAFVLADGDELLAAG